MVENEEDDNRRRKFVILLLVFLLLLLGCWSFSTGETTPVTVEVDGVTGDDGDVTIDVVNDSGQVVANGTVSASDSTLVFDLLDDGNYTLTAEDGYTLENNSQFSPSDTEDVSVTLVKEDGSDDSGDAGDSKLVRV